MSKEYKTSVKVREQIVDESQRTNLDEKELKQCFEINIEMLQEYKDRKTSSNQINEFQILKNIHSLYENNKEMFKKVIGSSADIILYGDLIAHSQAFQKLADHEADFQKKFDAFVKSDRTQEIFHNSQSPREELLEEQKDLYKPLNISDKNSYLRELFPIYFNSIYSIYQEISAELDRTSSLNRDSKNKKTMIDLGKATEYFSYALDRGEEYLALEIANHHVIDIANRNFDFDKDWMDKHNFPARILKNYILYADEKDVKENKDEIQNFLTKYRIDIKEILPDFNINTDFETNNLKLFRHANGAKIEFREAAQMLSKALEEKNDKLCKKIINSYIFDFSDQKTRRWIEQIKDENYQRKALEKYLEKALDLRTAKHNLDSKSEKQESEFEKQESEFEKLERKQKEEIFKLALKLKDEVSISSLAIHSQIYLSGRITDTERAFFEEQISSGKITPKSIQYSETAFLNTHLKDFLRLQPNYWNNMRDCHNSQLKNTEHGNYLARVKQSLTDNISFNMGDIDRFYLSTDLKSIESLYKKGLLNLDHLTMYQKNAESQTKSSLRTEKHQLFPEEVKIKIANFVDSQDLGARITKAAEAGNVKFLKEMKKQDVSKFDSAIGQITDFDKILKKGIENVLKSKNINVIQDKIDLETLQKAGLGTNQKLKEFVREPSGIIDKITEMICKAFLPKNYKYESKKNKICDDIMRPDSSPNALKNSKGHQL